MGNEQLKGHLEPLLLAVLETGPSHGYEILDSLRRRSGGVFDLPEGTIYPALHRLEDAGWVTSTREVIEGRRRRVYRLTASGRRALAASRTRWDEFSGAVARVLAWGPA
jgi:transcriptional regulator